MGQGNSSPLRKNPRTPYEYHSSDKIATEGLINEYKEQIQPQLDADARKIENELMVHDGIFLYARDILRIRYVDADNIVHYAVLSRKLRIHYLRKTIKIPFVIGTFINEDAYDTFIGRVITNV